MGRETGYYSARNLQIQKGMIKELQRKAKKQHFPIYCDPYEADCLVFINMSRKEINVILKKALVSKEQLPEGIAQHLDENKMNTGFYCYNPKLGIRFIFIKGESLWRIINVFDHEKTHLVHDTMCRVGMKLCYKTEEAYAYLSDSLTEQFLKQIK
jgi:hypothetical protein